MLKKFHMGSTFFSDKAVNNKPWSAEFVTIIYTENAMIRAPSVRNEMLFSSLQRVNQMLTIIGEVWATSHKGARVPWPISDVKTFLFGTMLICFCSCYYV